MRLCTWLLSGPPPDRRLDGARVVHLPEGGGEGPGVRAQPAAPGLVPAPPGAFVVLKVN